MRIPDDLAEYLLNKDSDLNEEQLNSLRDQSSKDKLPIQDVILKNNILSEEELTRRYAEDIGIPFIDLDPSQVKLHGLKQLPESIARRYKAIVFDSEANDVLLLAMENPYEVQALSVLRKRLGNNLKVHLATESALQSALQLYRSVGDDLNRAISDHKQFVAEDPDEKTLATQAVNMLIEKGVSANASDIHIEPRANCLVVRYRIDGLLKEANKLPLRLIVPLARYIKELAEINVEEVYAPQNGRFKLSLDNKIYGIKVSAIPTTEGEKLVLRIINDNMPLPDLTELGLWGHGLLELKHAIGQTHGLILVCGPTEANKSVTLYSLLKTINTPSVSISTVEDEITHHIEGVNQVEVGGLVDFHNGLASLINQDNDIIMLSQISSQETANLATEAALNSHLLLAGITSDDTASGLNRVVNIGVESYLLASTLRLVIGKRLARKLCSSCKQAYKPDSALLKHIEKSFALEKYGGFKQLHSYESLASKELGLLHKDGLSSSASSINRLWKANEEGCNHCDHSGYKGHLGLYEVLLNSKHLYDQIISHKPINTDDALISEGLVNIKIDGLVKALLGKTTVEEILRVS